MVFIFFVSSIVSVVSFFSVSRYPVFYSFGYPAPNLNERRGGTTRNKRETKKERVVISVYSLFFVSETRQTSADILRGYLFFVYTPTLTNARAGRPGESEIPKVQQRFDFVYLKTNAAVRYPRWRVLSWISSASASLKLL